MAAADRNTVLVEARSDILGIIVAAARVLRELILLEIACEP
jgi:hypothetical protein